jgi:hypothetical protein
VYFVKNIYESEYLNVDVIFAYYEGRVYRVLIIVRSEERYVHELSQSE